jgi:hypothetical protein
LQREVTNRITVPRRFSRFVERISCTNCTALFGTVVVSFRAE